jgi:5'-3' exonuclease
MNNSILIIDGLNYIYRASSGFNKGNYSIIYNFFRNLKATIEHFDPIKCFFILDGNPKFKKNLYSDYKGNRIKYSSNNNSSKKEKNIFFHNQKNEIIRLLSYLPIQIIKASDYEADDVIAFLCENLNGENICICSNDNDYIQLLQKYKNVKVFDPIKKSFMEDPGIHFLLFRALVGDVSDNIKGLMSQENALELCRAPSKLKEFLSHEENLADFNLNKQLIEFQEVSEQELIFYDSNVNFDLLKNEFIKMEFESILDNKYWIKFIEVFSKLNKDY